MTNSGPDVHNLIGEVIIAHRDQIDSPYLNAIHALRTMLSADPFVTTDTETHVLHVTAYAIKMLTSESDYSNEKSTSSISALTAISSIIGDAESIEPTDPWAAQGGDDHA